MPPIKCVRIVALRAEDLVPQDGKSCDPYVIMNVSGRVVKTERIPKNHLNPNWKRLDDFSFGWDGVAALPELQFTVMDFDYFGAHDFVGFARVQLNKFMIGSGEVKARLGVRSDSDSRLLKDYSTLGHLWFKLEYSTAAEVKRPSLNRSISFDSNAEDSSASRPVPLNFDSPIKEGNAGAVLDKVTVILGAGASAAAPPPPTVAASSSLPSLSEKQQSISDTTNLEASSAGQPPPTASDNNPDLQTTLSLTLPPLALRPQTQDLPADPPSLKGSVKSAKSKPEQPIVKVDVMASTTRSNPLQADEEPVEKARKAPPPPPETASKVSVQEPSVQNDAAPEAVPDSSVPATAAGPSTTTIQEQPREERDVPAEPSSTTKSTPVPVATPPPLTTKEALPPPATKAVDAPSKPNKDDAKPPPKSSTPAAAAAGVDEGERSLIKASRKQSLDNKSPPPRVASRRPSAAAGPFGQGAVNDDYEDEWAMVRLGGAAGGKSEAIDGEEGAEVGLFDALRGNGGGGVVHQGPVLFITRLQANNIPVDEGDAIKVVVDHPLGRFESEVQDWAGEDALWEDISAEVCPAKEEHEITFSILTRPAGSTEPFFPIVSATTYVSPMAVGVDTRLDCQPTEQGSAKVPDAATWGAIVFELAATGGGGSSVGTEMGRGNAPGVGLICPVGGACVRIMAGANLLARDSNGSADPYVVLMGEAADGSLTTLYTTETCKSTLNPHWGVTCRLEAVSPTFVCLVLYVYDEDPGTTPGDFLGQCRFEFRRCPLRGGLPLKLLPRRDNIGDYKFLQQSGKGDFGHLYIEWVVDHTVSWGSPRPSMSTLNSADFITEEVPEPPKPVVAETKKKRKKKAEAVVPEMLPGSSFNQAPHLSSSLADEEEEEEEEEEEAKEPSEVSLPPVPLPQFGRVIMCVAGAWRAMLESNCVPFVLEFTLLRIDKLQALQAAPVIGFALNGKRLMSKIEVASQQGASYAFAPRTTFVSTASFSRHAQQLSSPAPHPSSQALNAVVTPPMLQLSDDGITVLMLSPSSADGEEGTLIAQSSVSKSDLTSTFEDTLQEVIQSAAGEHALESPFKTPKEKALFVPGLSEGGQLDSDGLRAAARALMSGEEVAEIVFKVLKPQQGSSPPRTSSGFKKSSRAGKPEAEITLRIRKVYLLSPLEPAAPNNRDHPLSTPLDAARALAEEMAEAMREKDSQLLTTDKMHATSNLAGSVATLDRSARSNFEPGPRNDPVGKIATWLSRRSLAATSVCLRINVVDAFGLRVDSTNVSPYVTVTINSCSHAHPLNPYFARQPEKGVRIQGPLGVHPEVRTSFHELRKRIAPVHCAEACSPPIGAKVEYRTLAAPSGCDHPLWLFNLPPLGTLEGGQLGIDASHLNSVSMGRTTVQFAVWGADPDGFDVCVGGARLDVVNWSEGIESILLPLTAAKGAPSSSSAAALGYLRVEVGVFGASSVAPHYQGLVPASALLEPFIELLDDSPVDGTPKPANNHSFSGLQLSAPLPHNSSPVSHLAQPMVMEVELLGADNILPPLATTELIEYDRRHMADGCTEDTPLKRGHRGEYSKADLRSMKRKAQKKMNVFATVSVMDLGGGGSPAPSAFPTSVLSKISSAAAAVEPKGPSASTFGSQVTWGRPTGSDRYCSSLASNAQSGGPPPPGAGVPVRPYSGAGLPPNTTSPQALASSSVLPFLVGGSSHTQMVPSPVAINVSLWDGKGSDARFLGEASSVMYDVNQLKAAVNTGVPITLNLRPRNDPRFYADDAAVLNHPLLNSGVPEDDTMVAALEQADQIDGPIVVGKSLCQPNGGLGTITLSLRSLSLVQYERERRQAMGAAGQFYDLVVNISDVGNVDRPGWYCVEASIDSCTALLAWYSQRGGEDEGRGGDGRRESSVRSDSVVSLATSAGSPLAGSSGGLSLRAVLGTYTVTTQPDYFAGPPPSQVASLPALGTVNVRENISLALIERTDSVTFTLKRCLSEQQPADSKSFVPVAQVSVPVGHPVTSGLGSNPPIWLTMSGHPSVTPPLPCPPRMLLRWKATLRTSNSVTEQSPSRRDPNTEFDDWGDSSPPSAAGVRKLIRANPPSVSRPSVVSGNPRRKGVPPRSRTQQQDDGYSSAAMQEELQRARDELAELKERSRTRSFEVLLPHKRRGGGAGGRSDLLSDDDIVEERLQRIIQRKRRLLPRIPDVDELNSLSSVEDETGLNLSSSGGRGKAKGRILFEGEPNSVVSDIILAAAKEADPHMKSEAASINAMLQKVADSPYRHRSNNGGGSRSLLTSQQQSFDEEPFTMRRSRPADIRKVVVQRQEALRAAIVEKYALAVEEWVPAASTDATRKGGSARGTVVDARSGLESISGDDSSDEEQRNDRKLSGNYKRIQLILPVDMPVSAIWDAARDTSLQWRLRLVVKRSYRWQAHNTLLLDRMVQQGADEDPDSLVTLRVTTDVHHVFTGHPVLGRADASSGGSIPARKQHGKGKDSDDQESAGEEGARRSNKDRRLDPFAPAPLSVAKSSRILRFFKKVSGGRTFVPTSPTSGKGRRRLDLSDEGADDDNVQLLHFDLNDVMPANRLLRPGVAEGAANSEDDDFDDDVISQVIAAEASYQVHQECLRSGVTATVPMRFRASRKAAGPPPSAAAISRVRSALRSPYKGGGAATPSDEGWSDIDSDEEERQFEAARSAFIEAERAALQEQLQRVKALLTKGVKALGVRGFARPAMRDCTQQPLSTLHYDHYLSGPRKSRTEAAPQWVGKFYQVEQPCVEVYVQGPRATLLGLLQGAITGFPLTFGAPAAPNSSTPSAPTTPNRSGRNRKQLSNFVVAPAPNVFTDLVVRLDEVCGYVPVLSGGFKLASSFDAGAQMFQLCSATTVARNPSSSRGNQQVAQVVYSGPYDPSDFAAIFLDARVRGVPTEVLDASRAYEAYLSAGGVQAASSPHARPFPTTPHQEPQPRPTTLRQPEIHADSGSGYYMQEGSAVKRRQPTPTEYVGDCRPSPAHNYDAPKQRTPSKPRVEPRCEYPVALDPYDEDATYNRPQPKAAPSQRPYALPQPPPQHPKLGAL